MRVLVCGGRDYADRTRVFDVLSDLDGRRIVSLVIHGAYRGADILADDWAKAAGCHVMPFPADWKRLGRRAGPIRNQRMIDEGKPDLVVAFPGHGGTADMVRRAVRAEIEIIEVPR